MSKSRIFLTAVLTAACFLWVAGWIAEPARAQQAGHDHAGHDHAGGQPPSGANQAAAARRGPHGGQVAAGKVYWLETLYQPQEVRVYLYDLSGRPVTARGVQCQAVMQVRGNEKLYRYPMKYVAPTATADKQDYLAVAINLSRIRDGDMQVTFELANLPNAQQPRLSFTQTFALSNPSPQVTVVALTDADRVAVARQQVCPVSEKRLGGMGTPIKVLVGNHPLYLCCKGCLGKVQKNPRAYLPKPAPQQPAAASPPRITTAKATAADQAAIQAQGMCPVMGTRLGEHGAPLKVSINGQTLFLCCKGCLGKVEKDPGGYLAKAAQLRGGR